MCKLQGLEASYLARSFSSFSKEYQENAITDLQADLENSLIYLSHWPSFFNLSELVFLTRGRQIWIAFNFYLLQLPWWLSGEESSCQCRRHEFSPWVGKIPRRKKRQPTPYSCLGNHMDRRAWQAIVHGIAKSQT